MTPRRTLSIALCLAGLAPGTAAADGVRVVPREEPLRAVRSSHARAAPLPFTMVGVHWQGPGQVSFRTAAERGRWSAWHAAQAEDEDLPDLAAPEGGVAPAWRIGNPWWTGEARWIQYRTSGMVTRLRTFFVSSPVTAADSRRANLTSAAATTVFRPDAPTIVRRPEWGADEAIVRAPPSLAERVRFSVVHHTAGTNSYSASQSPAIVRGIQRYHVLSNGWNDIGYNFLVDKYGRIFEGRGGGPARNVIGAHAQGFNTGSVGVAVLGTYGSGRISAAARAALQRLLAWRLDVAHVDPVAVVNAVSFGNERFPAGQTIRLRAVSGHRDTGYTSCPGSALYGQLGTIARSVSTIGLPKLFDPEVQGVVGEPVRFTARLSSARAWRVEVRDSARALVAQGSGTGTAVGWTWDATAAPIGSYTYAISAGNGVRPATGRVPGPPPLAVTGLRASPRVLTPNGDPYGERTAVSFRLSRRAAVAVRVENAASGAVVRTLLASGAHPAGTVSLRWDGRSAGGALVADGRYRVEVTAESGAEQVARSATLLVDRTLGALSVTPLSISPNGDGRSESVRIGFQLIRPASVQVRIRREGRVVGTVLTGSLASGAYAAIWDGRSGNGARLRDGPVRASVHATTSLGTRSLGQDVRVDTVRPVVRVRSLRNVRGVARLRLTLSEPARLRIRYGRREWNDRGSVVVFRAAGTRFVWRRGWARFVRVVAVDAARNRSAAARFRLR